MGLLPDFSSRVAHGTRRISIRSKWDWDNVLRESSSSRSSKSNAEMTGLPKEWHRALKSTSSYPGQALGKPHRKKVPILRPTANKYHRRKIDWGGKASLLRWWASNRLVVNLSRVIGLNDDALLNHYLSSMFSSVNVVILSMCLACQAFFHSSFALNSASIYIFTLIFLKMLGLD